MYLRITKWRYKEWGSFVLLYLYFLLHIAIFRYPIILWDSPRYLWSAIYLKPANLAPVLVPYLLHPLVVLMGAWGFVFFQITILTYVLVSLLNFFNKNFFVGIASVLLSGAGFFAIQVMMDIYTAIGLLALFLVLNDYADILLYGIVGMCYVAHYENILLFPFCVVVYLTLFHRKHFFRTSVPILISFIMFFSGVVVTNYAAGKGGRFFTKVKYSMVATHIMVDSPVIARSYMEKYPDSSLVRQRERYEYIIACAKSPLEAVVLDTRDGFYADPDRYEQRSKGFLLYAIKNYKLTLLTSAAKNIFRFLILPGGPQGLDVGRKQVEAYIQELLPRQLKYARNSLQYKRMISYKSLKLLFIVSYYIAFPIILIFLFLPLINASIRNHRYYPFVAFTAFIMLANALIMSNVGIFLRYQLRIALLPCLAMSLIIADFLGKKHATGAKI